MDDFYKEVEDGVGGDFDFTQIEVTDCGTSREDSGINDIKELLDGIYEDAGMEKSFSDTVNDAKYIVFNLSAESKDGETFNLSDEMKYIFTCEDGTHILNGGINMKDDPVIVKTAELIKENCSEIVKIYLISYKVDNGGEVTSFKLALILRMRRKIFPSLNAVSIST